MSSQYGRDGRDVSTLYGREGRGGARQAPRSRSARVLHGAAWSTRGGVGRDREEKHASNNVKRSTHQTM